MELFNSYLLIALEVVTMANKIISISEGIFYRQPPLQFSELSTSSPPVYLPPPPFLSDVSQITSTYLLPNIYPPIGIQPDQNILPSLDDSVVISSLSENRNLPSTTRQSPLQVFNMSCLDSNDGKGFFRTFIHFTGSSRVFPVMETSSNECVIMRTSFNTFHINLEGQKMTECGTYACGTRICLFLRIATIPGLKLVDDPIVTLQCIPQEMIVSHTKHLQLSSQAEQERSNIKSVVLTIGGNQRMFETQVNLLKKSNGSNSFEQLVQPGSVVRLGDELLLKTTVRSGDGWRYSRMGNVIIRSASSQKSVFLVDENGCRNPIMRSICPQQPQQVNPLTVQFPFRAFLFQGAAPADDLLLTVKIFGCLQSWDCYQNKICDNNNRTRTTRAVHNFTSYDEANTVAEFQFRVLRNAASKEKSSLVSWYPNVIMTTVMLICTYF